MFKNLNMIVVRRKFAPRGNVLLQILFCDLAKAIIKFPKPLIGVARRDPKVVAEHARGEPTHGGPPRPAPRRDWTRQAHRWQGNSL